MAVTAIVNQSVPFPGRFILTVATDSEDQRSYLMSRDELEVLQNRIGEALDAPSTEAWTHGLANGWQHTHAAGDMPHDHPSAAALAAAEVGL